MRAFVIGGVVAMVWAAGVACTPDIRPAVIAHGGAGSARDRSPAVMLAARAAYAALGSGAVALDAAVAGAVVLEDDPTFNAGTGANVRLDGVSVQMDAAVMDSWGRFGAVAGIERVRNPVRVARAVIDSPHTLIAGDGATAFARVMGFGDWDPVTPAALEKRRKAMATLTGTGGEVKVPPRWETFDWRGHYDFQRKLRDAGVESFDTIGVLVRHGDGSFGGALSTGGTTLTLRGRIGDVPLFAAGLYVGPAGAVACTGNGEDIVRESLAKVVYEEMARGKSPERAIDWGVGLFPKKISVGLIAMNATGEAAGGNRKMAWAVAGEAGERMPEGVSMDNYVPPPPVTAAPTTAAPPASAPSSFPASVPSTMPAEAIAERLGWLQGTWSGTVDGGTFSARYTAADAAGVLSFSELVKDGAVVFHEMERFVPHGGGIRLLPYPGGEPAVHLDYTEAASGKNLAVFENPHKDFPTRITYARTGDDALVITTSDPHGGSDRTDVYNLKRVSPTAPPTVP